MANWYVWSGATGTGTGADWANAYVRLRLATAAKAAGDTFFVAHDHAETEAAVMAIVSPGTEALPCRIYCVNRAGSVPPVSADLRTTATITTTGAFRIDVTGSIAECYGIIFSAGTGATAANLSMNNSSARFCRYVNCSLRLGTTATSSRITVSTFAGGAITVLENTNLQFGNISQPFYAQRIIWKNTAPAIIGAIFPTVCFSVGGDCLFEGLDLSVFGSGKTLFTVTGVGNLPGALILKDCKLGSSVTIAALPFGAGIGTQEIVLIRCDSGDTNYRTERHTFHGRANHRDDHRPDGWRVGWHHADRHGRSSLRPIANGSFRSNACRSRSGTRRSAAPSPSPSRASGAAARCRSIRISGSMSNISAHPVFRLASKATSTKADGLAAGTNIPAGSGTWGGSTTKFAMSATFTPQEKGPITIYVRAAKVSSTFYIDPEAGHHLRGRRWLASMQSAGYLAAVLSSTRKTAISPSANLCHAR